MIEYLDKESCELAGYNWNVIEFSAHLENKTTFNGHYEFPMFTRDHLAARRSNENKLVFIRFPTFSVGRGSAPQRRRG